MISIKTCKIIYGYTDDCLDNVQDSPVLLIEPRTDYIDKVKRKQNPNVILITKVLVHERSLHEIVFYHNKDQDYYKVQDDSLSVSGTNMFNVKKYVGYTITLEALISQYTIQNIEKFIINVNFNNIKNVLDSLLPYNHILSSIQLKTDINSDCKILSFYKKESEQLLYTHRNLDIDLPNIGLYFLNENENLNRQDLSLLIQQYKMNIIMTNGENIREKVIVPYPDSVQIIKKPIVNTKQSKIYFENVINTLDTIFDKDSSINKQESTIKSTDLDIIIQFNPKYFTNHKTLQIMYPLKDDTIYINRVYDIMYATKNCMYMIYQILKSKYFTDYIDLKQKERPSLFKIFAKRYFYDYLSKIFVFKEF
jgi:hypothetical protein